MLLSTTSPRLPNTAAAPQGKGPLPVILLLVGGINLVTLPAFIYPGDNHAPRLEVAHWLETGVLGRAYSQREELGPSLSQRGQYFFENDERQVLFSKYGVANTVLFVPVYALEWLWTGRPHQGPPTRSLIFLLGCTALLLALVAVTYLNGLAALYTRRHWLRMLFVVLNVYATYLWYYLRAPALEMFQIPAFFGAAFHLLTFMRLQGQCATAPGAWKHLTFTMLWCVLLALLKVFFLLTLAVAAAAAVLTGAKSLRAAHGVSKHLPLWLVHGGLPVAVGLGVLGASNAYRFGSVWLSGYGQLQAPQGGPLDTFSLEKIVGSLRMFFVEPGNANAFLHHPVFVLGFVGAPLFFRQHRQEAALLGSLWITHVGVISAFGVAAGGWCYGPRYLVHLLTLCSLPGITLCEWFLEKGRAWMRGAVAAVACPVLLWSMSMQVNINILHYMTYYQLEGEFGRLDANAAQLYLGAAVHRGDIHRDVILFLESQEHPFLRILKGRVPPERWPAVQERVRGVLERAATPNLFFLRGPTAP